jgi:hypothetical protein
VLGKVFLRRLPRAGERTRDLLISFIFSFHHFTAEPQRLPGITFFVQNVKWLNVKF